MFKWLFGLKMRQIIFGIKEEEDFDEYQKTLKKLKKNLDSAQRTVDRSDDVLARLNADTDRRKKRIRDLEKMKR